MQQEYIIFSLVRLGLLLFSFLALPPGILVSKKAWETNDKKLMRKGLSLLWGALLSGFLFVKMFGGLWRI